MNRAVIGRGSIVQPARQLLLIRYLLIAILACFQMPFASSTAQVELIEDFRIWGNVIARGNFGFIDPNLKRWRWWMEAQPRTRESGKEMDQLLIRPGVGYALTDHSTERIGYAHVTNYPVAGDTIYENRIWQQY